jgi:hypothetical protein
LLDSIDAAVDDDLVDEISRLMGENSPETAQTPAKSAKSPLNGNNPRYGAPRPANIPTTAEMIDAALADAEARPGAKAGLRGVELVAAIAARWWPGVGSNSILPTAFALVSKGRLGRKGKLFVRVKANADAAQHHGVGTSSTH